MSMPVSPQRSVELAALLLDLVAFNGFHEEFHLVDVIKERAPYLLGDMPLQIETIGHLRSMLSGEMEGITLLHVGDDSIQTENGQMFAAKFSGALVVSVIAASESNSGNTSLAIEDVVRPLFFMFEKAGSEQMRLVAEYVNIVVENTVSELVGFSLRDLVGGISRSSQKMGVSLGSSRKHPGTASLPANMVNGINNALDIAHHTGGRVPTSGIIGHDLSRAMFSSLAGHIVSTADEVEGDRRRSEFLTDFQIFAAKNRDRTFSGDELMRIVQGTEPMV